MLTMHVITLIGANQANHANDANHEIIVTISVAAPPRPPLRSLILPSANLRSVRRVRESLAMVQEPCGPTRGQGLISIVSMVSTWFAPSRPLPHPPHHSKVKEYLALAPDAWWPFPKKSPHRGRRPATSCATPLWVACRCRIPSSWPCTSSFGPRSSWPSSRWGCLASYLPMIKIQQLSYLRTDHLGTTSLVLCGNVNGCAGVPNGGRVAKSRHYPYGAVRSPDLVNLCV
jgi:hypothetical protein